MRIDKAILSRFDSLLALRRSITGDGAIGEFAEFVAASLGMIDRVCGPNSPYRMVIQDAYKGALTYGVMTTLVDKAFGALKAARDDYAGGLLTRTRTLVRAEVSEDVLEQAEALLDAGYKDPAAVLAGVTLEVSLRDLCDRHSLTHAKLDKMNSDLAGLEVYNKGMQKQITAWAHWRNSAAHGKWNDYTDVQVREMVSGCVVSLPSTSSVNIAT